MPFAQLKLKTMKKFTSAEKECPISNKECPRKKWEDVGTQNFCLGHSLLDIRHSTSHSLRGKSFFTLRTQQLRFNGFLVAAVLSVFACAPSAYAQTQRAAEKTATPETKEKAVRPTLDLGNFKIHDLRPTRNETVRLTFKLHLALAPTTTEQQLAHLQHWQHRLRNQVIIAVRTVETKDFQAADLALLRRKILLRVNRLLKSHLAEEVLLTEYLFRLH